MKGAVAHDVLLESSTGLQTRRLKNRHTPDFHMQNSVLVSHCNKLTINLVLKKMQIYLYSSVY